MYTEEEKQFIKLRSKYAAELEQIWKRQEELENELAQLFERSEKLTSMLQGYDHDESEDEAVEENRVTNPGNLDIDQAVVEFLAINPGSLRKDILEGMAQGGYTSYAVDKSLRRIKGRGLVTNKGKTRYTKWYAVQ